MLKVKYSTIFCSVEPPLECSKWAAMMEMAEFAKDGVEVKILLGVKPPNIELTYKVEINGETEAQKRDRDIRNQEKKSVGKT